MSPIFDKLFKKANESKDILIVSGLPRSGTSMMMKILEAGGMEILTDNLRTADESNPRGYYEYERVKKLKEGDFDWLPLAQGKVVKIISALLEFLPNQYKYKIIFMHRDMTEVLLSQRKMLVRDGKQTDAVSDEKMAYLYMNHIKKIETWLDEQANITTLYISYNDTINDPQATISRVNEFTGGKLDVNAMLMVVDQSLYRERSSR